MKKIFKKLDNPFLLAAEGFVAGAILFVATNADSLQAQANPPAPIELPTIQASTR